jgi:hypothetical protein
MDKPSNLIFRRYGLYTTGGMGYIFLSPHISAARGGAD